MWICRIILRVCERRKPRTRFTTLCTRWLALSFDLWLFLCVCAAVKQCKLWRDKVISLNQSRQIKAAYHDEIPNNHFEYGLCITQSYIVDGSDSVCAIFRTMGAKKIKANCGNRFKFQACDINHWVEDQTTIIFAEASDFNFFSFAHELFGH